MASRYLHALILLIVIHVTEASSNVEPHCPRCSKYEYDEKTLEKLIRMEHQWSIFNEKWNSMEQNIKETMTMLKDAEERRNQSQKAREENLKDKILELNEAEVQREKRLTSFQEKQKKDINNTITNAHQQVIRMSQDMMEYPTAMNKTLAYNEKLKDNILELNKAEVQRENRLTSFQEKQKKDINNTITNAHQQVIRMSQDMMEYQTAMNKTLLAYKAPIVFFSVHRPTGLVDGVPTFSTVLGNVGDGYDTATGVFTCTVPGLYQFSFTFVSVTSTSGSTFCYIRHNGAYTVYAYTSPSSNARQSASATTYMKLVSGDKVDVGSCSNWKNVSGGTGMFSGALIHTA